MKEDTHFLIVGLGLLGGSYAQGLSKAGYSVSAIDLKQENIDYALSQHWISEGSTKVQEERLEQADCVIFGLYPDSIVGWIKQYQSWFKPGAILTDVTGVKCGVVNLIQENLRHDVEFVPSHPMAGGEKSGSQFSNMKVFENANFIVTPTAKNSAKGISFVKEIAEILKFAHITELSVQEHDKMISFVSQLTHVIAVTLMNTNDNTHLVEYTGDSFRDLTRIAKINENLWTELFLMNKENLLSDIDDFSNELAHFRETLAHEDTEEMKRLFRQSTERRKLFDK